MSSPRSAAPVDHWPQNARHWDLVGPPLRPSREDVAIVAALARAWREARPEGALRALILGVTPEIATLDWPDGTTLVGADRSEGMIRLVWPTSGLPARASTLVADWRSLPLLDESFDLVAGDGCYSVLAFPDEYRVLTREVRRVLAPGGSFVMRAFVQPRERETVAEVARALWAGEIGNFHVFKWRLAMAVQASTREGVRLADIWDAWREVCADPEALSARLGWSLATIGTIDSYRGAESRYTFSTLEEIRGAMRGDFAEVACHVPGYELGERCPTLVMR